MVTITRLRYLRVSGRASARAPPGYGSPAIIDKSVIDRPSSVVYLQLDALSGRVSLEYSVVLDASESTVDYESREGTDTGYGSIDCCKGATTIDLCSFVYGSPTGQIAYSSCFP